MITDDEIDRAVVEYCEVAGKSSIPKAFQNKPSLYFQAIEGLKESDRRDRRRRRLGKFLVAKYRREEKVEGLIDWDKFREWLKEHMAEINFLRLVISILMFMVLL